MKQQLINLRLNLSKWIKIIHATRRLKKLPESERNIARQALAQLFAQSRGLSMKMGQVMATGEENDVFKPLITSIEALPLKQFIPHLEQTYRQPLNQLFTTISESKAAASLGQVHYAQLHNQRDVAIKIRYLGIEESLTADLKLVDWLPNISLLKSWHFNSQDYKHTLNRQLLREIDYSFEAQTQQRFKKRLKIEGLHIPDIIPELSHSNVLVQSWEAGQRFEEACHWKKKQRLQIARTLLVTLFQSLFVYGEVHSDPHNGNYLFRYDDKDNVTTVLLDYGSTVFIQKQHRLALLKLLDAYHHQQPIDTLACFVLMGFDAQKLKPIQHYLPQLCEVLFLPFTQTRAFSLENWQLSAKIQALLGEQRWWFRAASPAYLVLLLRAFHGLVLQLKQLQIALPWQGLLEYAVGEECLSEARALELPELNQFNSTPDVKITARKLCVKIEEHQQIILELELPAEAALELEALIPESIRNEIKSHPDINLSQVKQRLHRQGIHPQKLLKIQIKAKHYHIWLQ